MGGSKKFLARSARKICDGRGGQGGEEKNKVERKGRKAKRWRGKGAHGHKVTEPSMERSRKKQSDDNLNNFRRNCYLSSVSGVAGAAERTI